MEKKFIEGKEVINYESVENMKLIRDIMYKDVNGQKITFAERNIINMYKRYQEKKGRK